MTETRRGHVERVAVVLRTWAGEMSLPPGELGRWLRACFLHDALRDDPASTPLDHGHRSADRSAREGERDEGVLSAVRYHTVGWATWNGVGRALYCADFLEPGRFFAREQRTSLAAAFPSDSAGVLREVAKLRITHAVNSGWALRPETVEFWNAVRS